MHLGEHVPARGGHIIQEPEIRPPVLRLARAADKSPCIWHAGLDRELQLATEIVVLEHRVPIGLLASHLEHTGAGLAHGVDDGANLAPVGDRAGHHLVAVERVDARGREADGAGAHGLLHVVGHGGEFVFGRLLGECTLAHHIGTERRVADISRVVDAFRQGVQGIEVIGVGFPTPLDAGPHRIRRDVLGPLKITEHQLRLFFPRRRQREPAVAHDHAGDAVVAGARAELVPENLGIHVRVAVYEARGHHVAFGVDGLVAVLPDTADHRDLAVGYSDIRVNSRCARTVDDGTVLDHQVVSHPLPCKSMTGTG